MSQADDIALLQRLRARDPAAFEELVRQSMGRMLATAKRFFRDENEARDAVQEAYVQAYKALPAFEGKSSLTTWLHAITVRACLMRLRHRRARPEMPLDELLPAFKADGHQAAPGPAWSSGEAEAINSEERNIIRQNIDRLPEDFRNVLLLRDIEEMDTREAAAALGVNEGVLKTRLHRARQALKTLLDPYFRKTP